MKSVGSYSRKEKAEVSPASRVLASRVLPSRVAWLHVKSQQFVLLVLLFSFFSGCAIYVLLYMLYTSVLGTACIELTQ